jgi:hypothetical protein
MRVGEIAAIKIKDVANRDARPYGVPCTLQLSPVQVTSPDGLSQKISCKGTNLARFVGKTVDKPYNFLLGGQQTRRCYCRFKGVMSAYDRMSIRCQ